MARTTVGSVILCCMLLLWGVNELYLPQAWLLKLSYLIILLSVAISFLRGGVHSYLFWVTLIGAYPLLPPILSIEILGYDHFSAFATKYQSNSNLIIPMLLGAFSMLFFACTISSEQVRLIEDFSGLEGVGSNYSKYWLVICCILVVAFSFLSDPSFSFVGYSKYSEIVDERSDLARFAGGAWGISVLFGYMMLLSIKSIRVNSSKMTLMYWSSVLVSALWLLIHARRVEVIGVFLFFFVFKIRGKTILTYIVTFVFLGLLGLLGYIRNHSDIYAFIKSLPFFPFPGGAENATIGWVVATSATTSGDLPLLLGESYLGHVLRLPPSFLGLERPITAYHYVAQFVKLQGGEYFLIEPFINFSVFGVCLYLILFVMTVNYCIRSIRNSSLRIGDGVSLILSATFFFLIFRTMWYGLGSIIKGEIIALLIILAFFSMRVIRARVVETKENYD